MLMPDPPGERVISARDTELQSISITQFQFSVFIPTD